MSLAQDTARWLCGKIRFCYPWRSFYLEILSLCILFVLLSQERALEVKWDKQVIPAWGTDWWNLGALTVIFISAVLSALVFFGGISKVVSWTSKHFFTITKKDLFPWTFEQRDHDETHVLEKNCDFILLCSVKYLPVLHSMDLLCCEGQHRWKYTHFPCCMCIPCAAPSASLLLVGQWEHMFEGGIGWTGEEWPCEWFLEVNSLPTGLGEIIWKDSCVSARMTVSFLQLLETSVPEVSQLSASSPCPSPAAEVSPSSFIIL